MAVIAPNSDVILLKVPLEIDENNQLTFANATAQYNYFNGLSGKLAVEKYTYQRKDGTIRFGANFDDIIGYNYVMYRNTSYSNKWFYAFITDMEYINDNVTSITIKTDPYQTWMFDIVYHPCLIDREHTNDDTVGKNTIDEGLDLGEYITNGDVTNFGPSISSDGDWVIVIDVSMIENSSSVGSGQTLNYSTDGGQTYGGSVPNQYVNGVPSGVYHLILGYDSSVVLSARDVINVYANAGLIDAVLAVYILPQALVGTVQTNISLGSINPENILSVKTCGGLALPQDSSGVTSLLTNPATYTRPNKIDGYTPKNNKLLCFPYQFMNVSNNVGTTLPYHYEDFSAGVKFNIEGILCPSGSVKAVPVDYKGISASENGYDYSIQGAKYPMCSWVSDSYTNWLTQNGINMKAEMTNDYAGLALGVLAGMVGAVSTGGTLPAVMMGVGAGAAAGVGGIFKQAREQHLMKRNANLVPDQVKGNLNSADIVWSKWRSRFTFLPMSIKAEYARCIDEYFSQYGYKCNRVKVPNITGRRNWNFVKTVGCYIDGDIPQSDLQEIKSMFDKGVTFWHNASTFGDYSQTNDILTV